MREVDPATVPRINTSQVFGCSIRSGMECTSNVKLNAEALIFLLFNDTLSTCCSSWNKKNLFRIEEARGAQRVIIFNRK